MLEVFTIGGGEYIVNVFNAVAAWTGGGGYKSLIKVVMVIGLIYSLMAVAFSMNVRAWLNWFLTATGIYLCLMVPTVQIKVTDRINPSLAPATVANVPLGLGVMASFTSQVGDYLTRTAETVFTMPSQLNYSTNGMIYGARLFDATRNFQIRDAEFATNLQQHFKQCVFGDIMLHHKSLTDLANSKDLWADLGPGSEARGQSWLERDPSGGGVDSAIVTCQQAYEMLSARWQPLIEAHAGLWGKEAYPRLSTALAAQKLKEDVPITNTAFTNASSDYTGTMRQMTAINAFMQARDAMAGGTGSAAIDTFATTRADIQARNTYNSIAYQAMSWVPILNIVLTVVFYAMFPVIFPLFLLPQTGVGSLRGYATGFFYLASWGPLYVILHMICMTKGEYAAQGVAEGGVTLSTFAGIGAVNAETATIAGFLVMSVPFMAGALAKGAMSVSTQATSMLAPAQNAAEASALEQTTGNYAYGNVSYANSTSNMRQSNQWSDAQTYSTGAFSQSVRGTSGVGFTTFADGNQVIDATPSISRLPFAPQETIASTATQSRQAATSYRIADGFEQAKRDEVSHLHALRNSSSTTLTNTVGFDSASGVTSGTSNDLRAQHNLADRQTVDDKASVSAGGRRGKDQTDSRTDADQISGGVRANVSADASLGAGGGTGLSGKLGAGVTGDVGWNRSRVTAKGKTDTSGTYDSNDKTTSIGNSITDEQSVTGASGVTDGTYSRQGQFAQSSRSDARTKAIEESLSKIQAYSESARHYRELGRSLEQNVSYAQSHGFAMSQNLSNELQEFYSQKEAHLAGTNILPALHATNLSAAQEQARNAVVQEFLSSRSNRVESELQSALNDPALKGIDLPTPGNAGDISKLYHGGGVGGAAPVSSPSVGQPNTAIVDEGARLLGEKHRRALAAKEDIASGRPNGRPTD
ncbi:conjugal transfer protein TraG N-terminal domain-containing protein [Sphingomonas pituitosa]|uniref:conjugal transfer protein TraG N-terminal domain-containing protein n=1 Tax=Sphingomonas pituitosa TaxID=99597 RepID=UPI00082E0313|nr:conjugal transfer protein TraG N-terminal domain-containing protein [Sphingomonas pituitosa]